MIPLSLLWFYKKGIKMCKAYSFLEGGSEVTQDLHREARTMLAKTD